MSSYKPAPEVKEIAEDLIQKYHQHLIDYSIKIEYVFVDKTPKSNGREVWGKCKKVTSLNAYLASPDPNKEGSGDPFFVIIISEPIWDLLSKDKKIALVDHELCHAWAEENQKEDDDESPPFKVSIKPHDLEEFSCIVRRHGLWREDVKEFIDSASKKD